MRLKQEVRVPSHRTARYDAPSGGWVQSGNIVQAPSNQCEVLDNFIPTSQGARLRGGRQELADLGASVARLFTYRSAGSETLFGATATAIYDCNNVGGGSLRTTTSGDWSTVQTSTAGGQFSVGVNGTDTGWTYNGIAFSDISLTGVTSSDLSQVWLFKERLFFIEENTTSAWYLPVETIGGTVSEIDLGSVMSLGGSLIFGATWSLDSGSGQDDVCVFVSDQGEIAVYEGSDPSSVSTWRLRGVYQMGHPLDKHSFFKAGGDLLVLTEDGIVPVSAALMQDRAALQANAITYPIEDAWKQAVLNAGSSFPITATLWQSGTFLLVGVSTNDGGEAFVSNARTGAWGRVTGWDVRCSAIYTDLLYFGSADGKVYRADTSSSDDGTAYTGVYVPKFAPGGLLRDVNAVGITYRSTQKATFDMAAHADYVVDAIDIPPTTTITTGTSTWGTGVWGTFVWGGTGQKFPFTEWQVAYAAGYSVAPSLAITVNQTEKVEFELLEARLRYEEGYPM